MSAVVKRRGEGSEWRCDECDPFRYSGVCTSPSVEGVSIMQREADQHNRVHHPSSQSTDQEGAQRAVGRDGMSGTRYERVRFAPENGTARTIILRVTSESDELLLGIEVDREGDEVAPAGVDERLRIIEKTLVRRRTPLAWDLFVGVLAPQPTDQEDGR